MAKIYRTKKFESLERKPKFVAKFFSVDASQTSVTPNYRSISYHNALPK